MTTVRLYKDIGLDPSFKKTIDFTSKTQQSNWFTSKTYKEIENVNYNKPQNLLKIPNMDYSEAVSYTYCSLIDLDSSDLRTYYFFVQSCAVVDSNTVQFQLVLDPIQTFMCEWELDECMVTRGHVDRWNTDGEVLRVTPNLESVTAFMNVKTDVKIQRELNSIPFALAVVAFTSNALEAYLFETGTPTDKLYYGIFPIWTGAGASDRHITGVYGLVDYTPADGYHNQRAVKCYYPSKNELISGQYLDGFNIATEDIVGVSILPAPAMILTRWTNSIEVEYKDFAGIDNITDIIDITENEYVDFPSTAYTFGSYAPVIVDGEFTISGTSRDIKYVRAISSSSSGNIGVLDRMMQIFEVTDSNILGIVKQVEPTFPEKPASRTVTADPKYEPALFMEPYITRTITDGKGHPIVTIPDNVAFRNVIVGEIPIYVSHFFDGSTITDLVSVETPDASIGTEGGQNASLCPSLYVVNDQWKTYALTQRDTDRQSVINNSIQQAIDNAIFMGYGGALVGSRSASGSRDSPDRRNQLLNSGARSAISIALGASVVTSLIDSHFAWQNQMIKETQIKNKPAGLLISGTGQSNLNDRFVNYHFIESEVDDVTYTKAYDNFRKYGYVLNYYTKLDIRSRVYYNYVLTNGAIIKGSLNQDIKNEISAILDNGITIYHGDYTSTLTMPDYENIERSLI